MRDSSDEIAKVRLFYSHAPTPFQCLETGSDRYNGIMEWIRDNSDNGVGTPRQVDIHPLNRFAPLEEQLG